MAGKGREVGVWIAGVGAGILFFGSVWSGAALADDPIPTVPIDPPPVTTVTPAPGGTGSVATGASPGAAAPAGSAMTDNYCRYFPSQAAAQVYFTSVGGSATNNVHDLDVNHNGIACEDYNYGTYSSGTTATSPSAEALSGGSGVTPTGDRDCRDFSSQTAAQLYFTAIGGSATNNADDLDANHNCIACEVYEYGTAGTPGAGTAGALGSTTGPPQVSVVPRGGVNTGDGSFTP
jgi:hypothetical protein